MLFNRRTFLLGSAGAAAGLALGATSPLAAENVQLRAMWWGSNDRSKRTLSVAKLFQEKNPDISIVGESLSGDGYWTNVWNAQPFCTSYWGGRPTQDQMYSTAYLSNADWNDTRFQREDFDKLLLQARSELDEPKRKDMYRTLAMMVRDEGGVILPMFNDFVNASTKQVKGYVHDIGNDMSNGYVATRVWLDA